MALQRLIGVGFAAAWGHLPVKRQRRYLIRSLGHRPGAGCPVCPALKAQFNVVTRPARNEMSRAFSAGIFFVHKSWAGAPGSRRMRAFGA